MPIPRKHSNRNDPFDDDFFSPFGDFLAQINRVFDNAFRSFGFDTYLWDDQEFQKELKKKGHIYYGYSAQIDSDGKPNVRTWSNIDHPERFGLVPNFKGFRGSLPDHYLESSQESKEEIDPYMDLIRDDEKNLIKINIELPGLSKNDVKLKKNGNMLIIRAKNDQRSYFKEIALEEEIDTIKSNFNNGILEIVVTPKKATKKEDEGEEITIN